MRISNHTKRSRLIQSRWLFQENRGITTSEVTFVELALLAKRYNLDPVKITASVMAICGIEETTCLKAATYIREYGFGVFDAFHAAHCGGKIISSDSAYDKLGIERIKLEK